MRWARIRNLVEGVFQRGRTEGLPNEARDDVQRPQDYGFAANPVEGQGLTLEVGGHTVIVRMDRLGERPALANYEVAVWHKDGHSVKLGGGGLIEITGVDVTLNVANQLTLNAGNGVVINSATLTHNGVNVGRTHTHGGVAVGLANTTGPS